MRKALIAALIAASLLAPLAYTQGEKGISTLTRAVGWVQADEQKRIIVEPFFRTELFFGTAKSDGSAVTAEEWRNFLDREITPRFPDGLTVLFGTGQFRDSSGAIIQERSIILILLYPVEARAGSSDKIEQIRDAYKLAFQQQSVLRVDDPLPVLVSFLA